MGNRKPTLLIILGLVVAMTVMIAASLSQVELQPGLPLPSVEGQQVRLPPLEAEPLILVRLSEFAKAFLILTLVGTWLYLFYKLIRGADFKDFAALLKPVVVTILLAGLGLFLIILLLPRAKLSLPTELVVPTVAPLETAPLGPVPSFLFWVAGLGLLVLSLVLGIWILTSFSRRPTTVDLVGLEAEKARQALQSGQGLKEVILLCYRQMSQALGQENGLERKDSMTTREFENILEAAGLPQAPVHQLTLLFEAVRYGNWEPNLSDDEKALQALEAIIAHSRLIKKGDRLK